MRTTENKHRSYFFTWNNYTEQDYDTVKQFIIDNTQYGLLAREIAPTTGTKHIHFYFYFTHQKAFNKLKNMFPKANIQAAKGTAEQNKVYISKTDIDYFEYGEQPKQGKRSDIQEVLTSVQSGETMREIIPKITSVQSVKFAETCMKYFEQKREFKTRVLWLYGKSNTGKTKYAYQHYENLYSVMITDNLKWWDGYDRHKNVIIDDLRPGIIDFTRLLRLLDRYEFRVETKGSTRQMLAETIIITSSLHPEKFVPPEEEVEQLLRRIDKIIFFE